MSGSQKMIGTKTILAVGLAGLLIGGCAAGGPGSGARSVGNFEANCKQLDRKMRVLVARGKGEGQEYRRLLDTYLARRCHKKPG